MSHPELAMSHARCFSFCPRDPGAVRIFRSAVSSRVERTCVACLHRSAAVLPHNGFLRVALFASALSIQVPSTRADDAYLSGSSFATGPVAGHPTAEPGNWLRLRPGETSLSLISKGNQPALRVYSLRNVPARSASEPAEPADHRGRTRVRTRSRPFSPGIRSEVMIT